MIRVAAFMALAVSFLLPPGTAHAEGEPVRFIEGRHYVELDDARRTRASDGEVEVIEFFWYGCSHCYATERHINAWLDSKPDNVKFLRVPATLNRGWLLHARAFYAAEHLGIVHQMHDVLFNRIHRDGENLRTVDDIARVFEQEAGIEREQFNEAFESFAVGSKLKQADTLARSYPLRGVPTMVIAGKYITSAGMAESYSRLLDITRYLSERELESTAAGESAVASQ